MSVNMKGLARESDFDHDIGVLILLAISAVKSVRE